MFSKDRAQLFANGSVSRVPLEQAKSDWPVFMSRLQQQLAREEGEFLLGAAPSLADFAVAHCLWFLRATPVTAPLVDDYPEIRGSARCWASAMARAARCLARMPCAAREAEPAALPEARDPNGFGKASR